jgi:hypothetical protein
VGSNEHCSPGLDLFLFRDLTNHTAGVSGSKDAVLNIPSNYTPRTDNSPGANAHTGKDERPATDPNIRAYGDRFAELLLATELGVQSVHGRENLNTRTKESEISNLDRADIEHDAVEIEKDAFTEFDIGTVVTEEGWLHRYGITALTKKLEENLPPNFPLRFACCIQSLAKVACPVAVPDQVGIQSVVKLASKHFVPFRAQSVSSSIMIFSQREYKVEASHLMHPFGEGDA